MGIHDANSSNMWTYIYTSLAGRADEIHLTLAEMVSVDWC